MKIYFSKKYLFATLLLFTVEIFIAIFHFNPFIRGFFGDVLVILLLYSFLKIFIKNNCFKIAASVLAFSYWVEVIQFFKLAETLNIQSKVLLIILGSVFDPMDLLAYFMGFLIIILFEKILLKNEYLKNISL